MDNQIVTFQILEKANLAHVFKDKLTSFFVKEILEVASGHQSEQVRNTSNKEMLECFAANMTDVIKNTARDKVSIFHAMSKLIIHCIGD
jgi:hypothetical protein